MKRTMVLAILLGIVLSIGLGGCAPKAIPDEVAVTQETLPTAEPEVEPASIYSEAPELAERVANGDLPPVEERLPTNPVVIQPVERVGVYGGTWRMGMNGLNSNALIRVTAGYENLLRWNPEWTRIVPNLAQSYEVNDNATEFTFHLREGVRWSDGVPFTADDILFGWEMENLDDRIWPGINKIYKINDVPAVVEKIDNYTIKYSFASPYGRFPVIMADVGGDVVTSRPMHYLKQFHIDFNPEGIDALVKEAGVEDWVELWKSKTDHRRNPDIPTMNAWVLTTPYPAESEVPITNVIMERNPYYWKIDTNYNQLPYIDQINFTIYPSSEDIQQAAMDGDIDMQHSFLNVAENYQQYLDNMETGEYEFHTLFNERSNTLAIHLNMVHQDPDLRSVFSNKTFRIALSQAINRAEVIDQVYGLDLEPYQPAPLRMSPHFRERLATQYTTFDPTHANTLLDEAGYDQRDTDGCRLTPEGIRIEFNLSVTTHYGNETFNAAEMVAGYWHELGIYVNVTGLEVADFNTLVNQNNHDAVISHAQGGYDIASKPGIYMPYQHYFSYFAVPWANWYWKNNLEEEPPAPAQEQMQLYDQILATSDPDEVSDYIDQILAIAEEEFYVMGICPAPDIYALVKTNFHNVPMTMPKSFSYPTPAPTNPCQYFIDPQE